ncbi:MAG: DUF6569 family protein [Armatimonadota bacterium]
MIGLHSQVAHALQNRRLGDAVTFKNLTLFPLMDGVSGEPDYLTLEEVLKRNLVEVTEVSSAGSVNNLKVTNRASMPVFIMDGEELVGAKQNRVVNLSILVPAEQTIVIPVSCVEAGRWHHVSPRFRTSRQAMPVRDRARKSQQVYRSLSLMGEAFADQSEIWEDLDERMMYLDIDSDTRAMTDIYEHLAPALEEYERAFRPVDGQTGVLAVINGRIVGMDVFDFAQTLRTFFPKLVRSYALDCITFYQVEFTPVFAEAVRQFVERVAHADSQTYPAVGEGEDVRFHAAGVVGSALVARGRMVHLCAFSQPDDHPNGFRDLFTRLSRASLRRERYIE